MNVYDFDNTIYDGESTFDFYMFCVKKDISMLKYAFIVSKTLLEYKLCRIDENTLIKRCEKYMISFIDKIKNPDAIISEFWDKNEHKIKDFYKKQKKNDDIIISASCDILLKEIAKRLGIENLVATEVDFHNHKVKRICYGKNKVKIFNELYKDTRIDEFYSDSKNDEPMARISNKAFFVTKDNIKEWRFSDGI